MALPGSLVDASSLRQVPDSQEVFLQSDGDGSIIVEIVEFLDESDGAIAAKSHWEALAEDNDAYGSNAVVDERGPASVAIPTITCSVTGGDRAASASANIISGIQRVAKFSEAVRNTVAVHLLLLRLPAAGADLLFTVNVPLALDPASSSYLSGARSASAIESLPSDRLFAPGLTADAVLAMAAESISITDWELFDAPQQASKESMRA